MNWQTVDISEVYKIHEEIIKRAGTKASVRDFALLHSAVERPKATYDGRDLYPTIVAKAAALLQSLCLNHAFTDGNKRTSWAVTHRFLWVNGIYLSATKEEAVAFLSWVDNKHPDFNEILSWIKKHSRKI